MKTIAKVLGISALLSPYLTGCGLDMNLGTKVAEPQVYSLDGVKWLSPSIADGQNPATMLQPEYLISPQGHLLMRFEDLGAKVGEISLGDHRKVEVSISLTPGEEAEASMSLCPITKNWMMLATWRQAFPMGTSGDWENDGGDYDPIGCVTGVESPREAELTTSTLTASVPTLVKFDVTNWIVNDVRGRRINYGLILLSTNGRTLRVRGDRDAAYSPRISWIKSR